MPANQAERSAAVRFVAAKTVNIRPEDLVDRETKRADKYMVFTVLDKSTGTIHDVWCKVPDRAAFTVEDLDGVFDGEPFTWAVRFRSGVSATDLPKCGLADQKEDNPLVRFQLDAALRVA